MYKQYEVEASVVAIAIVRGRKKKLYARPSGIVIAKSVEEADSLHRDEYEKWRDEVISSGYLHNWEDASGKKIRRAAIEDMEFDPKFSTPVPIADYACLPVADAFNDLTPAQFYEEMAGADMKSNGKHSAL